MINILVVHTRDVLEKIYPLVDGWGCNITVSNDKITLKDGDTKIDFVYPSDVEKAIKGSKYHYIHVEDGIEIDDSLYTTKWDLISSILGGNFKLI